MYACAEEESVAQVTATTVIRAPLVDVYRIAKDVERFPEFMPDVQSIRVLSRSGARATVEWVGLMQGRKVRWVEEETWDDTAYRSDFRLVEGDFSKFEGSWRFETVPDGTQTSLVLDYEMELPLAGALLSNLLRVLVRKNLESMLAALKGQLEGAAQAR
jgi:ribosome-associated toxin RatA of RatAB toxin-antitoxin module